VRRVIAVLTAAGALALPGTALAGGWATVEMSSTPDGTASGEPWVVDLTILQHGRTPLAGLTPRVTITGRESGDTRVVTARPLGQPGVYRARVVFPADGSWDYVIDDGFSRQHTYAPVQIGAGTAVPAGGGDDGARWIPLVAAGAFMLLLGGLAGALLRRGPAPAPERRSI
jgi:hypothetical protein